jgi:chromate transporter
MPELSSEPSRLSEVMRLFLRLGATGFGGPAAHISMMQEEVVDKRQWLSRQGFLDLLGATNLIPGPNSTEMAIHIGYLRAGWRGLLLGGASFILPAMLITMGFGWIYVTYGSVPALDWLMAGIYPVVIAIIFKALVDLGRQAIKGWLTAILGLATFVLYLLGVNEVLLLLAGAVVALLAANQARKMAGLAVPALGLFAAQQASVYSLSTLFFTFLKIGFVLYGSGYVLLAFLHSNFVEGLGWLTQDQLLTAITIGQVTPGPVFTTATFIGYILGGVPGALAATVGIFLPAFVLVAVTNPYIPRMRASAGASALLDGVNAVSLGLMGGVTLQLSRTAFIDWLTIALGLISLLCLFRFRINPTWLILGGALIGFLRWQLTGS